MFDGEDGSVNHAQLRLGTSAIMLGWLKGDDRLRMRTLTQAGGVTQGIYVVAPTLMRCGSARSSTRRL